MNYDPFQITVETTEGDVANSQATFDAFNMLLDAVDNGAFALDNDADPEAMAAYFRVAAQNARAKSRRF